MSQGILGSVSSVGVKDSSTTLGMTLMFANVNVCVTLNEVEGSFDIYTPTFVIELFLPSKSVQSDEIYLLLQKEIKLVEKLETSGCLKPLYTVEFRAIMLKNC